jgi:hypothetical protein
VQPNGSGGCIVVSPSLSEYHHGSNYNESTGRSSSPSFTAYFSGTTNGKEQQCTSPVTMPASSTQSANIRFEDRRFSPFNVCSSSPRFSASKSSHFWVPSEENMVTDAAARYDHEGVATLGLQVSKLPRRSDMCPKLSSFFATPFQ